MTDPVTYKITLDVLWYSDSIPISEEEFKKIRKAKRLLIFGIGLEEKFDLVLENFAELERDLLNIALERSIFPGKIEALLDDGPLLVNRRIVNFLTTARLYLDQIRHDVSGICIYGKDSRLYKSVEESTHKEYDSVLGYRVMEFIRNRAQHRSLPTHTISFRIDKSSDPARFQHRVVPLVSVEELEDDPNFKDSLRSELLAVADEKKFANLHSFIRDYVESFGRIHQQVRDITTADFVNADDVIAKHRAMAADKFGSTELLGLAAIVCNAQGLYIDREHLSDRPTERRKDLEKKNQHLSSISRSYVSSIGE